MDQIQVNQVWHVLHAHQHPLMAENFNLKKTEMVVFEGFSDIFEVNVRVELCNGQNVILREHFLEFKVYKSNSLILKNDYRLYYLPVLQSIPNNIVSPLK